MPQPNATLDKITSSLLDTFVTDAGLEEKTLSEKFEHFAAHAMLASKIYEPLATESVVVGQDGTPGIDAVAIIVNETLIASEDDLEAILETVKTVSVEIIFLQAKTSPKFDGARMTDFAEEVYRFFTSPDIHRNLLPAKNVMDQILGLGMRLKQNPDCRLMYVSTGQWIEDDHLTKKIKNSEDRIASLNFFENVSYLPVGAKLLQKNYRATKNQISTTFTFTNRSTISGVEGVTQAFLGTLPAPELLKIIADDDGDLRREIFEDNVRDFQGTENVVNEKIRESIKEHPDRFAVLNNGVTLVAKTGKVVGDTFTLENFQIVNGCQTANVIHGLKDDIDIQPLSIPLRVVITEDDKIATNITSATNSQTEVRNEELLSLLNFQRELEQYFTTSAPPQDLYFERRSRQYQAISAVPKNRIVTRPQLVKAFASTFLDEPHKATGYYTTLYRDLDSRLFKEDHKHESYYAAAVAQFRLDTFLKLAQIDGKFKPARYQILHTARHLAIGSTLPRLTSKEQAKLSNKYVGLLWDEEKSIALFQAAAEIVEIASKNEEINRAFTKRSSVTNTIIDLCREQKAVANSEPWHLY